MNLFKGSLLGISIMISCQAPTKLTINGADKPFLWENATVYFILTDRFNNGNPENDFVTPPEVPAAPFRGFMGGDIRGIINKLDEGYFEELGVNTLWMTPLVEQIKGSVDEGTGTSYAFHGYWTADWTRLDERFGTEEELKELVEKAHRKGIRVLMDIVANHTGPVTDLDPKWPDEWVKTGPICTYIDAESTINCTLVENLPDVRTEVTEEVNLPEFLQKKWEKEGRLEEELAELDKWFQSTGFPRTPANYILKWIVDLVKNFGIDGFRVDTAKHTEPYVWRNLWSTAKEAYENYKKEHPEEIPPYDEFYMVGEVYNYHISEGREFNYGDQKHDFFTDGFKALINFDFKNDAQRSYEEIFQKYDLALNGPLKGKSVLNYISSHDDGNPFDQHREHSIEAGTKLLLCPGGVQIYYGDESARSLSVEAKGDAILRSPMNWDEIADNKTKGTFSTKEVLSHWQKLGQFRNRHLSVGAGRHQMLSQSPYIFSRTLESERYTDKVLIGLDLKPGLKTISVFGLFPEETMLIDSYSGFKAKVENGKITVDSAFDIVLLEEG